MSKKAPSKRLTLSGHAEEVLREMIFSGELEAGARVYPEEAAAMLGISPIPVREALRSLASRGLVDAVARRGYRVRPADRNDFSETYELRMLLDPRAARMAVPRMGADSIDQMYEALLDLERTMLANDVSAYDADHRAFHFSIYNHCGSRWLLEIMAMLWENSQRYQRLSTGLRGSVEERVAEHRAIADACSQGDADTAAHLIWEHLDRTRVVVFNALDKQQGPAPVSLHDSGVADVLLTHPRRP